jgi:hypothetical protein
MGRTLGIFEATMISGALKEMPRVNRDNASKVS